MKHLSKEELRNLLLNTRNDRDRLMLLVGYYHGLRASEIINIKGTDIELGMITVKRLKGSKETTQPLMFSVDPLMDERTGLIALSEKCGRERLFPMTRFGVYQVVKRGGKRAGIHSKKLSPHSLKHSVAYHTIKESGICSVRDWLGHVSMNSTSAYLNPTTEEVENNIMRAMGITRSA